MGNAPISVPDLLACPFSTYFISKYTYVYCYVNIYYVMYLFIMYSRMCTLLVLNKINSIRFNTALHKASICHVTNDRIATQIYLTPEIRVARDEPYH